MAQLPQNNDESSSASTVGAPPLLVAMLAALLIRCYGLSTQSFSNDELIDLEIARQPWLAILSVADGFPPLHHLLLKAGLLLTDNPLAGRWLSVVYGVLAVPIVGLLANRIAGRGCGIVAAWLLAIAPMHVYFSQEGRAYALFFLVTALATWLFWRALQIGSPRSWATFALFASIGGYVHYYYLFVLMAFVLIWGKQGMATGQWAKGFGAFCCIGLLSMPVLSFVWTDIGCQQAMRQGSFSFAAVGYTGWSLLTGFCVGPSLRELHSLSPAEALQGILPWLIPVGAVVGGLLMSVWRKGHPYRIELLTLLLIPILCAFLAESCFDLSNYNVRYVIPSLLPLIVLTAIAVTSGGHPSISILLGLILLAVSFSSIVNRHQVAKYQNIDSASASTFLAEYAGEPQRVYTLAHYMQVAARHYLPAGYEVVPLDDVTSAANNLEATIQQINSQDGPFWVFYSREFHGDPAGIFKEALLNDPQVEQLGTWTGVALFRGTAPITRPIEQPTP
ncbi:MAG: glycosyltransferase family 39 protein [Bythopirellula sp.]